MSGIHLALARTQLHAANNDQLEIIDVNASHTDLSDTCIPAGILDSF